MTVIEYLNNYVKGTPQITFIKARARKDAHSPYYHPEYQTTPLFYFEEAKKSSCADYIVLNDEMYAMDWLSGGGWNNLIKKGFAKCLLIISREDLELLYEKAQAKSTEEFIGQIIMEKSKLED